MPMTSAPKDVERMRTTERKIPVGEAATAFLANKRIAVTGVSRNAAGHGSNVVYQRLRERGYQVFPVNPNADLVEGDKCYHNLRSIQAGWARS
jgi:predicted CoA-binding protein